MNIPGHSKYCLFLQAFEDDKTEMKKVNQIQKDMISLNIGGNYYSTSKSTLFSQKSSMLATMFSGYHKLTKSEDGSYFIDADGKHFDIILNHLRGRIQYATDLPDDKRILLELRKEADFYNLVVLKDLIDICLDKYESAVDQWKKNYIRQNGDQSESVRDVLFRRCDVGNYSFENITFRHKADFEYANLTEAVFSNCTFYKEVSFRNAELVKTKFTDCNFQTGVVIYFDEANLDQCDFGNISNHFHQQVTLQSYQDPFYRSQYDLVYHPSNQALESLASRIEMMSFCNARNMGKAHFPEGKLEIIKRHYQADSIR